MKKDIAIDIIKNIKEYKPRKNESLIDLTILKAILPELIADIVTCAYAQGQSYDINITKEYRADTLSTLVYVSQDTYRTLNRLKKEILECSNLSTLESLIGQCILKRLKTFQTTENEPITL